MCDHLEQCFIFRHSNEEGIKRTVTFVRVEHESNSIALVGGYVDDDGVLYEDRLDRFTVYELEQILMYARKQGLT